MCGNYFYPFVIFFSVLKMYIDNRPKDKLGTYEYNLFVNIRGKNVIVLIFFGSVS